jgi:hypothetical protein
MDTGIVWDILVDTLSYGDGPVGQSYFDVLNVFKLYC